jgi:Tfp pilus assembly protein PilE
MKRKQKGMTLIGFIISMAVAGVFVYVGMQIFPMYNEFFSSSRQWPAWQTSRESRRKH